MRVKFDEPQLVRPINAGGEVGVGQLYHLITVIVQRDKLRLFADFQAAATVDAIGGTVNSVTRWLIDKIQKLDY